MRWLVGVTLGKRPSPLDQIELFNCPTLFDISVVHDISSGLNGAVECPRMSRRKSAHQLRELDAVPSALDHDPATQGLS